MPEGPPITSSGGREFKPAGIQHEQCCAGIIAKRKGVQTTNPTNAPNKDNQSKKTKTTNATNPTFSVDSPCDTSVTN